jgi:hypothetical protein
VKINVHGPLAGTGWDGMIHSWSGLVEVDDTNPKAVAWARYTVGSGAADLVEDAKTPEPTPPEPTLTDLRAQAEAKGLATYGSKAQLQERLAAAESNSDT